VTRIGITLIVEHAQMLCHIVPQRLKGASGLHITEEAHLASAIGKQKWIL